MYKPGKEAATRCEYRAPDPACNPYLAFAVMLAAGMKGVENNYPLPEPVEEDIYHMSEAERVRHGIAELPGSLHEAIQEAENSALIKETLGDSVCLVGRIAAPFSTLTLIVGIEATLMLMLEDPGLLKRYLEFFVEYNDVVAAAQLAAGADALWLGDCVAT